MSDGAQAVMLALLLLLPLSALASRRLRWTKVMKMALAWVTIFAAGLVLMAMRERYRGAWDSARAMLMGADQIVMGDTVRISMADDGHFYADAVLNGTPRRMLIDSGATVTALSQTSAAAAGIKPNSVFETMLDTAKGPVAATRASVAEMRLGGIQAHDLPVVVSRYSATWT
jgi:aspartyl protease family protein